MTSPARRSIVVALVLMAVTGALGVEEDECSSAYNYLAGCLTFLQGPDALPNPICCSGVTDLNVTDPHCLCTIIRDLNQNSHVNYTKACALPSQCRIAVDVVQCPTLTLPPGYPMPPALPPGYRGDLSAAPLHTHDAAAAPCRHRAHNLDTQPSGGVLVKAFLA